MKTLRYTPSSPITTAEVRDWFGESPKARLATRQHREIAAYLTKMRWRPENGTFRQRRAVAVESNRYWDFDAVFRSARLLHDSLPAMLDHWKELQWAPETSEGHQAIKALEDALSVALPYIEWPFGRYKRRTGHKEPKTWHIAAVIVANLVMKVMKEAGHKPGVTRNSIVVRVVHKALIRMGYPDLKMFGASAVAAYLVRRDQKYGLNRR